MVMGGRMDWSFFLRNDLAGLMDGWAIPGRVPSGSLMPSTTGNGFTRSRTGPMTCHLLGFIRLAHAGHSRPYLFTIQAMPLLFQVVSIRLTEKPFFIIQKKMGTVLRRITVWTYLQ